MGPVDTKGDQNEMLHMDCTALQYVEQWCTKKSAHPFMYLITFCSIQKKIGMLETWHVPTSTLWYTCIMTYY